MSRSFRTAPLMAGLAVTLLAGSAHAGNFVTLNDDATLQMFDSSTRKVTATVMVKGLSAPLAGIDFRPADSMLYGLQRDGQIVTIDIRSGQATPKARLDQALPANVALTVDFNPVADRMRVVGADGTNLRINVDDGKTIVDGRLKFAETDANKGAAPFVLAGAYSNKFKGTKETALYDIDGTLGAFLKQAPPNDGVLVTLGKIGKKPGSVAFNIETDGKGGNTGWLLADGMLATIDLANGMTGKPGPVSGLKGQVRDLAVMPPA